jgi:gamma-glutamyltranspeptidase
VAAAAALAAGLAGLAVRASAAPARVTRGAVAADHMLASQAGASLLGAGGNAVDAAIAAALASGVVQPSGSGLGGGGFAVVARPSQAPLVLDFREVAPAAATPTMFSGGASSTEGGLAVAVPAEALGLYELHRRAGRAPWREVVAPATRLAASGFEPGAHLARELGRIPSMRALFDDERYRRARTAKALRALASTRGEAFRTGWVAQDFVDGARARGGILAMEDLRDYRVEERAPVKGQYRGYDVFSMPPPSSGGLALLSMLASTEGVDDLHCQVEAAKHAMAARATWGDPRQVDVQAAAVLSPERAASVRAGCGERTFGHQHYAGSAGAPDDHGTLHVSAMDESGLAVALTTTINTSFGSKVIAPRSGIVLNNQMDDFATKPGTANAFGLVQGEQNAPRPGNRPLSSMTPTLVMKDGQPVMAVGASGGPFIITATYQVVRAVLDRGSEPDVALATPRWHHQWLPDAALVEGKVEDWQALADRGHVLRVVPEPFSSVQVVTREGSTFRAASDPRKGGEAVVVE